MRKLLPHQLEAIENLQNGNILWGAVGAGKTATVLGYYVQEEHDQDLYIITTAKKRDSLDWEGEAAKWGISRDPALSYSGDRITVDSWNNISKYTNVKGAFFVFDEQRVVGSGAWVKSFLKITRNNRWILLSATPGDTWIDYIPVFVANGFYKNATEFKREHVIYEPYRRFPVVRNYVGEEKLVRLRDSILVEMDYEHRAERVINWLDVGYDVKLFGYAWKNKWNVYENRPFKDVSEMFMVLRRVNNEHPSRMNQLKELLKTHKKIVVFYTFNYELHILRELSAITTVAEWNGHRKQPIPDTDSWVYLVQYSSGSEGWNCIETNAIVFYSMTYSYKYFKQAMGRIDRLDTPWQKLYYYVFSSNSFIDKGIQGALKDKKNFNEKAFAQHNLRIENWLI
jgi:hypothetical protein